MVPPFFCILCRSWKGVLHHIVGPTSQDLGFSMGNGWAATGMTWVLATITKSDWTSGRAPQSTRLLDTSKRSSTAPRMPMDTGLLRNYLTDQDSRGHGFGELQLTEWLSFSPAAFDQTYVAWADSIRGVLGIKNRNPHVRANGTVTPVINPYARQDKSPYKGTSPEANSFVMLLYVAWRDCVQAGNCPPTPAAELSSTRNILYAPRLCHLHSSKCLSMNSTSFLFHAAGCDLF